MNKFEYLALFAGFFTLLSFSNLVFNVSKSKITENLSFIWIFLSILAQSLMLIYGIINGAYGIIITSSGLLIGLIYILYIKVKYKYPNEKIVIY